MKRTFISVFVFIASIAFLPLAAISAQPETADQVRERRAKRQLEKNRRSTEREAQSRTVSELGEMPEIDPSLVEQYTEMLHTIADPSMEGRIPGSQGIEDAAQYIESHLDLLGLTPAFSTEDIASDNTTVITPNTTYRQQLQMGSHTAPVSQSLSINGLEFIQNEDFTTLAFSGSDDISAPVIFTGYAIVSGPNNYLGFQADQSIEDHIAICLNYEPMDSEGNSLWRDEGWSHNARLTYKVSALQRRGAKAVIIVNPPQANDPRVKLLETIESTSPPTNTVGERTGPEFDIPVIHATSETINKILDQINTTENSNYTLDQLIEQSNQAGTIIPLTDSLIDLDIQLERTPRWTSNIGAILPGQGALKDEYIVIGAHYDHVGYGKFGTRTPHRAGEVHPGADDNGTGTTATLLSAYTLTQQYKLLADNEDARSVLFLWFTAEESGLNGSRHYVKNPITELEQHVMMLNMDMIGSLSDGLLEIGGFDSSSGFETLLEPHLLEAKIPYSSDISVGSDRSDHASFNAENIPNLFFFTGLHDRYHSPDDTIDWIDEEGCVRVSLLVSSIAFDAATDSERLVHRNARAKKPEKEGPNVRVGIIPSNSSKGGMNIERVFEDTSASEAGLRSGDRITKWNEHEIDSVETWMPIVTANEPGDQVALTVVRDGETIELTMTLRPIE